MEPARWVRWCAYTAFLSALPSAVWRALPGFGVTMGTPAQWREFQDLPGTGTWYVLGLSVVQVLAAACCLLLSVNLRRFLPGFSPSWVGCAAARVVGIGGLIGAAILTLVITMSVIAWEKVDPFSGQTYNGWAWLCLVCYLSTVLWPLSLVPASIGRLMHRGPVALLDDAHDDTF